MYAGMPSDDFKELMMQALSYRYGDNKQPDFTNPMTSAVWMMLKKEIDFNEEKWARRDKANAENGKKGGRPKKVADPIVDAIAEEFDFNPEFSNMVGDEQGRVY